jgi:transcriptional regulator of acetoin/glycerol metabolism
MGEGLIGVDEDGMITGIDRTALSLIEMSALDIGSVKIQQILDVALNELFDLAKKNGGQITKLSTHFGKIVFLKMQLNLSPKSPNHSNKIEDSSPNPYSNLADESIESDFEAGALKQLSKIAIQKTLEKTNGNISLAAKLLRISRNTLYRYLRG